MKDFFIADTHFGDKTILAYENRPFSCVEEMDAALIENWNRVVSEDDRVYLLGDIGDLRPLQRCRGTKYLIKGNHDTESNAFYRNMGFAEVYDLPVIYRDFWILSHQPLYVNANMPYANLFGHVHNNPNYASCSDHGFCVSAERIGYTPMDFETIREAVKKGICDQAM